MSQSPGFANFSVPPFLSDGLTTLVDAALKAARAGLGARPLLVTQGRRHRRQPAAVRPKRPRRPGLWLARISIGSLRIPSLVVGGHPDGDSYRLARGSRASRSPSPKRLKAKTVTKMAMPGQNMKCGCV